MVTGFRIPHKYNRMDIYWCRFVGFAGGASISKHSGNESSNGKPGEEFENGVKAPPGLPQGEEEGKSLMIQ
jgi:hypothetical protein